MSRSPQIHIFFGAPILPTLLKKPKEDIYSAATTETWKKLCLSFAKDTFTLYTRKCKCPDHAEHQMPNSEALSIYSKDQLIPSFRTKCELVNLTACAADAESIKSFSSENKIGESTGNICHVSVNISTENQMNHLAYEHLLNPVKTDEEQSKQSEDNERAASYMIHNHSDFSPLPPSTSTVSKSVKSMEQDEKSPAFQCDHCQLLGQYLTIHCPQIMNKSKTEKPLHVCASLGVSTDTEYLSILTSSQVAFLSGTQAAGQNHTQSKSAKDKGVKLDKPCKDNEIVSDPLIQLNENASTYADIAEINCTQNYDSSPELFDSSSPVKENSTLKETSLEKNGGVPTHHLRSPDNKCNNEFCHTEPPKIGTLCSQGDWSAKRPRAFGDTLPTTNFRRGDHQQSKKAKSDYSSICPVVPIKEQSILGYKKAQKYPSLLKECLCKGQKYTVLVTVLHPCHIKEIQIKSGTKLPSNVPLATVVVFDQSEVQRKVMLWRAAAFWSLTVFPGDIILLTESVIYVRFKWIKAFHSLSIIANVIVHGLFFIADVILYENCWSGETMLQSTFTSQLLNLGSCSTVNQNEFSHVVNVNILQDLLAYVSSRHTYLEALPQRKIQTLNNIQHALLHQLEPDILVHAVMKIVNLTVLTDSTYSFKGERKRKIILTVEQVKDQNYTLVLWGALTALYHQLQRKRDHIWEFKYLFTKHNLVSGELELHTTPWSTLECLFDDDQRAVEFKEKFEKDAKPLMRVTSVAAHLVEKCSGIIQVKAHISELKFTVASSPRGEVVFDSNASLQHIHTSLALITYAGCAKCGFELQVDDNKIYKQCVSCLPSNKVRTFYRPALMTIEDGGYEIHVQVISELIRKMFLNIPAEWLSKTIEPSLDITYGMIVADLCHALLTDTKASYLMTIRSHFVLDENSYPLENDFHLLSFHLDL
ncbi:hypothetical protein JD844_006223 [Phrynosoma platyrhinos]|uniref:Shieldin complex subunit 2 n=1 Tax=Phrynosoma platyrhinos TaxID=52577 RepID=A0ABQ7T1T6_PHRPL|nr:hypothetical protein JD844_006223 [Phrynosoma platyrhinos]